MINHYEKANKFWKQGLNNLRDLKYEDAEVNFLDCLKLAPDEISIIQNLIGIYIETEQKNKLKILLKSYDHLFHKNELQYGYAFDQYFDHNYSKSIEICKKLLTFDKFKNSITDLLASNFIRQ